MIKNYKQLLKKITTIILDVDGVLTDGSVLIAQNGEQLRTMHVKDGYALQLAVKKGYRVVIMSGGRSDVLEGRFNYLGIKEVYLGLTNKLELFENYIKNNHLQSSEILYIGDDIPDYEIMNRVGVACCPADAVEEIKKICHYISPFTGGTGCVRDVLEQIMKVQAKWFDSEAFSW
ncbi:MAG: 3-deoxy-D-manno-octulosonate 8-phosphate phosphatase KdsC [Bacteroidetes bacterium ADurb.Bin408]|nr:MAG: 3-deoxy-D-manno-octulosonate 8-phosphate phosphatase KdsC [Bacteroidetes bacterium ADurb.Bin408]